jgi:ubiquinone/menaquinone biosynthesis C-methylase UbiE
MNENEQRFSTAVGEEYDLFRLAVPHHDDVQNETVSAVISNLSGNDRSIDVLEIGFGTGLTSEALLHANRMVSLVAIDNESEMLAKAVDRLGDFVGEGRLVLLVADALSHLKKCEDGSLDVVVSVWVLHKLDYRVRNEIFSEIYRVLKPSGVFVNGDKIAVDDEQEHKEHLRWQISKFDIFESMGRPDLKEEWINHYYEDETPNRVLYAGTMKRHLLEIGFSGCEITKRWYLDAISVARK